MTDRELNWLLGAILAGAGIFLVAAIWALWAGVRGMAGRRRAATTQKARSRQPSRAKLSGVSQPGRGEWAWYDVLWLALLAVMFSWLAAGGVQASGWYSRMPAADQAGFWFYWRGCVLPALGLGILWLAVIGKGRLWARPAGWESGPTREGGESGPALIWRGLRWVVVKGGATGKTHLLSRFGLPLAAGMGLWLAGMFVQRVTAALTPAGLDSAHSPFEAGLLWKLPAPGGALGAGLVCAWLILVSPVVEELFFRGVVLPLWGLGKDEGGRMRALMATSLLAAIYGLNLAALPALFLVNVGLGWLSLRLGDPGKYPTPDLFTAWLAHSMLNSLIVVAWWWKP